MSTSGLLAEPWRTPSAILSLSRRNYKMSRRRLSRKYRALFQAEIPEVFFSVDSILESLLNTEFKELAAPPWAFLFTETLAFVRTEKRGAYIGMHSILNHNDTPVQVIRDVLAHELLHLRYPPREIEGRWRAHHEQFVQAQRMISPTFHDSFHWILINFAPHLNIDIARERVWVKVRSPSAYRYGRRLSLDETREIAPPAEAPSQEMLL